MSSGTLFGFVISTPEIHTKDADAAMKPFVTIILALFFVTTLNAFDQKGKSRNRSKIRVSKSIVREVKPAMAQVGEQVKIEGMFDQKDVNVSFNGVVAQIVERDHDEVKVIVPNGATSGKLVVTVGEHDSVAVEFTVVGDNERFAQPSTATASQPVERWSN